MSTELKMFFLRTQDNVNDLQLISDLLRDIYIITLCEINSIDIDIYVEIIF